MARMKVNKKGKLTPVRREPTLEAPFDPSDPTSTAFNIQDPTPNLDELSITVNEVDLPRLIVLFISDIHYGNPACDLDLLDGYLDWVKKRGDILVVGNGDWMENVTRDSVGDIFDQTAKPQRQIDFLTETFAPIKDKIVAIRSGNHELRTERVTGIDPMKIIASRLEVPYLRPTSYHIFKVRGQEYKIVSQHGSGSASVLSSKINKVRKMANTYDADLYCLGHSHHAFAIPTPYLSIFEDEIVNRSKWFVNSGHFLNYFGTYADRAGMEVGKRGSPKIKLYGNEWNIHCSV